MMAKSMNALFTGRIQKRKTNPLHHSHLACNTRPVHTGWVMNDRVEPAADPARLCPESDQQSSQDRISRRASKRQRAPQQ
jgi:hypothetical protein